MELFQERSNSMERIVFENRTDEPFRTFKDGCVGAIRTINAGGDKYVLEAKRLGGLFDGQTKHQAGSVWDKNKVAPTIDTMHGGCREPMIIENVIIGGEQKHQAIKKDGICTCLTSSMGTGGGYVPMIPERKCISTKGKEG